MRERNRFIQSPIGRYSLAAAILVIVGASVLFINFDVNPITGFISYESYRQQVDLSVGQGRMYILSTTGSELNITSFAISGEVIGDGQVEVYLQSSDQKLMVFQNIRAVDTGIPLITGQQKGGALITGLAVGEGTIETGVQEANYLVLKEQTDKIDLGHPTLEANEEVFSGPFVNTGEESRFIFMQLSPEKVVRLVVNVEPGTRIQINEVLYTLQEE